MMMSFDETAAYLQITLRTLRKWIKEDPHFPSDRAGCYDPEWINDWIRSRYTPEAKAILGLTDDDEFIRGIKTQKVTLEKRTGLYFLFNGGVLVYIGQTRSLYKRLAGHIGVKTFTSYAFIPVQQAELDYEERKYIQQYRPPLNIAHKR